MQGNHARHDGSQGAGNLGIARVGMVELAFDHVRAHRRMKGRLDLGGRAGELQHAASTRDFFDGHAMALQPGRDSGHVVGGDPEALGEHLGTQPVAVRG